MRIAYLIHTFPEYSSTFIVEEIDAMRSLGARIQIFAIHVPRAGNRPDSFDHYARETQSLFPLRIDLLVYEHIRALIFHPVSYCKSFWFAARGGKTLSLKDRFRTLAHWVEAPLLYRLLRKAGISHVHVHFLFAAASVMWFVKQIYGIAYSITAHGSDIFVEKVLQLEKLLGASFIRVMTEYNRDVLENLAETKEGGLPALRVIPLGVKPGSTRPDVTRPDVFTFLHVGRMVWQKGQGILLQACRILADSGYKFRLILVGDGPLRLELEKVVHELKLSQIVSLVGALPKENILSLYQSTHCFVLSSLSEGSPVVLMEAMSEGQPVIAPKLHGIPEMFSHGREGWLFETGSALALAEAMEGAMGGSDNLTNMGHLARETARERFDLERNTQEFLLELKKHLQ